MDQSSNESCVFHLRAPKPSGLATEYRDLIHPVDGGRSPPDA
ncbi:hypothetical protein RMSM_04539 [Rhodopirellula maiorica SM1]|uniref:Uncharacterized protein n=1 Tax=Rhodopirellula maiorica SM1 TaxID=1265738 RepID=M5RGR5_9BACT|nr:hypothetical protein RMSM_04539 [Rhodopirellula maiorica SM1]